MSTIIRTRSLKNGFESLYLDITHEGIRRYEPIGTKVKVNPKTKEEKDLRKVTYEVAKKRVLEIELAIAKNDLDISDKFDLSIDFLAFFQNYIDEHKLVKDIRLYKAVLNKLKDFTGDKGLRCSEVDSAFLEKFWSYLNKHLNRVTPHNYISKVKIVVKSAIGKKHFKKNPFEGLNFRKGKSADKHALSFEELLALRKTPCKNAQVKKAAMFSCNTGLRFCDVVRLTWSVIHSNFIEVTQKKTGESVQIPLNNDAKALLGTRKAKDELIFKLPSHTAVLKCIDDWTNDAGITKKITYHSFRCSFATNLIASNVSTITASELMGHQSLKYITRYVRISDNMKHDAVNRITLFNNRNNNNDGTTNRQASSNN